MYSCGASVAPASERGSTQSPSETASADVVADIAATTLVADVEEALKKLMVPPDASAAIDLISTISGNEFLRDCVMAAGYEERRAWLPPRSQSKIRRPTRL
jgi:hypothetical protein